MAKICEAQKANGNIRASELAILAILAAETEDFTNLFEIGTFDGRTTMNLAMNSPAHCRIYTLDLPPEVETRFALEPGERHMVDKPEPGLRYKKYKHSDTSTVEKIHQLLGDSATFDCAELAGSCSLVFVDGSHAYDYAMSDTALAMHLVKEGGVIVWHDYGIWEGVTQALEFLEQRDQLALKNIRGTSLVYWKKPARQQRNVADCVVCATPKI